jgi:hypothetical protein
MQSVRKYGELESHNGPIAHDQQERETHISTQNCKALDTWIISLIYPTFNSFIAGIGLSTHTFFSFFFYEKYF